MTEETKVTEQDVKTVVQVQMKTLREAVKKELEAINESKERIAMLQVEMDNLQALEKLYRHKK